MLSTIREKIQGWFAAIVIGMITVPFALWGINSYFEGRDKINVAEVDGVAISVDTYKSVLEQRRRQLQQALQGLDTRVWDNPALKQQVVNSLVERTLSARYAEKTGYRFSDAQLNRLITQIPQFQTDGRFDPARYQAALRNAGMTPGGFEKRLREDYMIQQFRQGITQATIVPSADLSAILALETQKREFAYAVIAPDKFLRVVTASEDAIQTYYSTHIEQYRIPEQVRIEYLRVAVDDVGRQAVIAEEELRKAYNDESQRFVTPEQRRASHILLELPPNAGTEEEKRVLAQAQELRAQLVKGADFAALARKYSKDAGSAAKGGDLGYVGRGAFVKEFETVLYGLKTGALSEPVKTQYGYHLIKLTGIKPEVRRPFNQVRSELEAQLRRHKAEERFYELSERFRNLVYEHPDSLKPAAEALNLSIQQSDWFSRKGAAGIAADPRVIEAAFHPEVLEQGRNSELLQGNDNTLIALRVVNRRAAVTRPLAEVRAGIEQEVKRQLAQEEAAKVGVKLLERLKQGEDLSKLARQQGLSVSTPKPMARRQAGVDNRIVAAVFKASRPQSGKAVYDGVSLGAQGYAVFSLRRVEPGDPTAAPAEVKQAARQLLERRYGEDYFQAYLVELRKRADVEIYSDQL